MENRRRTINNIDKPEKQQPNHCRLSCSIDETIDEHIEYVYNGTFSISRMFLCGILNLICPCFCRKRKPNIISN